MIKFALKFILLILIVVGFSAAIFTGGNRAHSQDLGYHVPEVGHRAMAIAFCDPTDHDGVNRIKAAIGNYDDRDYWDTMADPAVKCWDANFMDFRPFATTFVEIESLMQIDANGQHFCMVFKIVQDANGTKVWTWRPAQDPVTMEKLLECP